MNFSWGEVGGPRNSYQGSERAKGFLSRWSRSFTWERMDFMKFWSALVIVEWHACCFGLSLQTTLHGRSLTPYCSGLWASNMVEVYWGVCSPWGGEDPGDWYPWGYCLKRWLVISWIGGLLPCKEKTPWAALLFALPAIFSCFGKQQLN